MCAAGSHEIDARAVAGTAMISSTPATAASRLRCASCDALRRPGGARGVDQRQQVVGLSRRGGGLGVEAGVRALDVGQRDRALAARPRRSMTITCSTSGQLLARLQHDRQERLLGDDRPSRRRRRRRRRSARASRSGRSRTASPPSRHDREVGEVELGPVDEHQRDGVAALDAERRAARRRARRRGRAARPRSSSTSPSRGADRDAVGVLRAR